MDPMVRLAMRMAMWFRNPPSRRQVILMGVVLALCVGIFAVERWLGWPSWLTLDNPPGVVRR